jgi:hypothetical protein
MKAMFVGVALLLALPVPAQAGNSNRHHADGAIAKAAEGPYKELAWDELVPKDWDPSRRFRKLDLGSMKDGDERAMKVLEIMKEEWDSAPINASLDGRKVRIPGFVVPIEEQGRAVTEFLLVPYFGACIHVPPPPANQIIHVVSPKPIKNLKVMDAVWVLGELKAARYSSQTPMGLGAAGYRINSVQVTAYKEPAIVTITPSR